MFQAKGTPGQECSLGPMNNVTQDLAQVIPTQEYFITLSEIGINFCYVIMYLHTSNTQEALMPVICGSLRLSGLHNVQPNDISRAPSSSLSHPPLGTGESLTIYSEC